MARLLARIGGFSARHRWLVLLGWVLILVLMVGGAATLAKPLNSDFDIAGLSSVSTLHKIDREFGTSSGGGGKVVIAAPAGQRLTAAEVGPLRSAIAAVPGVAVDPKPTMSPDGRVGFLAVRFTGPSGRRATARTGIAAAVDSARQSGLRAGESSELTSGDAGSNPVVGLVIALLVLLVTFGSLLAAGLPLLTALLGLGTSLAGIYSVTAVTPVNDVAPTLALLLALAVGIDYTLFIVNRHRRQVMDGMAVRDSIALAVGTAGSAVFFAALTVMIALAGLAVMRVGFLTQMGVCAAGAVFVAMLLSITLTPALLSMAGQRVLGRRARRRLRAGTHRPAGAAGRRWAAVVTRFPLLPVIASMIVLGLLAVPVLGMRLGLPNDGSEPRSSPVRTAYDLMAEGFGAGVNGPILVLGQAGDATLVPQLSATPDVARVIPSGTAGGQVLLTVYPDSWPSDEATSTLVHTLRERPGIEVTGQTAVAIDVSQRLQDSLPLYLALVVGFAFLLLLVVFRSVLIPVKATISFLLSLGATLGCTVAVFQWDWLGRVFGVDPAGPLLSFLPILVIGVLFGLSMDYEMFLVTGMREEHAHGAEAHQAVVTGFGQGARVVTAAALIMIGVFGNGTFTGGPTIKAIAFALAVGVLVDAFVVRMTLVPAAMMLFGRAAWWFPRWLDRLTPRVDLEGTALRHLAVLPPAPGPADGAENPGQLGDIPDEPAAETPVGRKSQLHTAGRDAGQM
jgi:RND superfamily putative drug exporter